jgi:hypothetical protein
MEEREYGAGVRLCRNNRCAAHFFIDLPGFLITMPQVGFFSE